MSQNSMTRHASTIREEEPTFSSAFAASSPPASRWVAPGIGERIHRIAFSAAPPATLLPRAIVGGVFLLEGILKFLNPGELGVGRFIKIGIPLPAFFAPFDGVFEIGCGILLILGLMTRLAAIPMIINMIVAITSTKVPLLLQQGFWKAAHEARLDFSMLLGCIFLLLVGAGPLSLDSLLASRSRDTVPGSRHPSQPAPMLNKTILTILAAGLLLLSVPARTLAGEGASRARAQTATAMAPTATRDPSSVERMVEVRLTEFKIEMPLRLNAGQTLFKVTNAGTMFHRFEIEGKGMEKEIEPGVDAGQTKTLKLDLEPGAYEVYCPVHGHKKAGMSLRLQVS
jgi:uncharacterized membrane protein YphA (DoxX/SURF4 family)/uncharacterized cupredoxin-like copper-binding protein